MARGGPQREVHPQAARIAAQNAARIARRRQAAILAESFAQADVAGLSRTAPIRKVGGRFETLQAVPLGRKIKQVGLTQADLTKFLSQFNFQAFTQDMGTQRTTMPSQSTTFGFAPSRFQSRFSQRLAEARARISGRL